MRAPNFLYIGPPKAGSTWIYEALRHHPDVYLSPAKELHYFDYYYSKGANWYLKHFSGAHSEHKIVGEISHDYLYSEEACKRIARDLGSVKLMVCLREPVERAFSDYLYMVKQGYVRTDFEEAIQRYPEILEHSRYAKYLDIYRRYFGLDSMILTVFDDLKSDSRGLLEDLCGKLEISNPSSAVLPDGAILPAAAPRNYIIARVAKSAAQMMRRAGMVTSITKIKSSPVVQAALYKRYGLNERPNLSLSTERELRRVFSDEVSRLDSEYVPGIATRWGY